MPDVLIFEDDDDEIARIVDWLNLHQYTQQASSVFQQLQDHGGDVYDEADHAWRKVKQEIRKIDPLLVVMDYLLSGTEGSTTYDGADYGNRCKELWPKLGVVLVTTGSSNLASQNELDEQKAIWQRTASDQFRAGTRKNDAIVDFAWIKPWGTAEGALGAHVVQNHVQNLVNNQSLRPSEQQPPLD
jgi:hypothetical protein